jgi:hypothetical protein
MAAISAPPMEGTVHAEITEEIRFAKRAQSRGPCEKHYLRRANHAADAIAIFHHAVLRTAAGAVHEVPRDRHVRREQAIERQWQRKIDDDNRRGRPKLAWWKSDRSNISVPLSDSVSVNYIAAGDPIPAGSALACPATSITFGDLPWNFLGMSLGTHFRLDLSELSFSQ